MVAICNIDETPKDLSTVVNPSNNNVFNLRIDQIPGTNTEVLAVYLHELDKFMKTHQLSKSERMIYTALYTSLQYYQEVSNPSSPFFQQLLEYTNKETLALMKKHPELTIKTSLRVKSPVSAYNKIVAKIGEYIEKGRDLNELNTSLRDFIGIRRIVDLKDVLFENPSEETERCYDVALDQLRMQRKSECTFIPVGEKKLAEMKAPHEYNVDPTSEHVYIPSARPPEIEMQFDPYLKDYIAFPKKNLYQTLQYCVFLPFSKKLALEYQVRTQTMHTYAERGGASHDEYKENSKRKNSRSTFRKEKGITRKCFVRANLPIEYVFDSKTKKMRPLTLDESMKSHLGFSFKDRFGISEEEFYKHFTKDEQDSILSHTAYYTYNPTTQTYTVEPLQTVQLPSLATDTDKLHAAAKTKPPIHSAFER